MTIAASTLTQPRARRGPSQQEIYNRLVKAGHAFFETEEESTIAHIPVVSRADKMDLESLDSRCGYSDGGPAYLLVRDIKTMGIGSEFILSPEIERLDHGGTILKLVGKVARPYSGLKVVTNGEKYTTTDQHVARVGLNDLADLSNRERHIVLALHVTLPERYARATEIKRRFDSLYRGDFL